MIDVIDDLAGPLVLDEIDDHECLAHDDLAYDYLSLTVEQRRVLELTCDELTSIENAIRRRQYDDRNRIDGARRITVRTQRRALGLPVDVSDVPVGDLWGEGLGRLLYEDPQRPRAPLQMPSREFHAGK